MSLRALRETRLARQKPGVVMVVIGELPEWFDYDPGTIVVRPGDDLRRMDWRPMVGLLAAVFLIGQDLQRFLDVLDALRKAGAVLFGAANFAGVHPLLTDANEEHERLLKRAWEQLCQC
jgi:hypothetical protein